MARGKRILFHGKKILGRCSWSLAVITPGNQPQRRKPESRILSGSRLRLLQLVKKLVARLGGGSRAVRLITRVVAGQTGQERRHFKRHLLARRRDGYWLTLNQFDLVVPGIHLHASTQGQSCDLVQ